jgi:hypothetical protein
LGRIVHISIPDGFEDRWNRFKTLAEEHGGISKCIREAINLWLEFYEGEGARLEVYTPELGEGKSEEARQNSKSMPDECDCPYCDYISNTLGMKRHPKDCNCEKCAKYRRIASGEGALE